MFEMGDFTPVSFYLGKTGYSRTDCMTLHKVPHPAGIFLGVFQHMRAGSNYRHFAAKDIKKLGEFIE